MIRKNSIIIRPFQPGDELEINCLVRIAFDEFVAPGYSEEGNRFFYDFIVPEKMAQRQLQERVLWCALSDGNIIGIIEMRDGNHISLLFVDKAFHRQGVAKMLMDTAIENAKLKNPDISNIQVHSSPYAVAIYERFGFHPNHDFQVANGIRYLPMEMRL
jgi:GNAT superfamily N-acetyltransferase